MKKALVITIVLVILLSMLPMSGAFAKSGGTALVEIRNATGATITVNLSNGKTLTWYPGTSRFTIASGYYTYYAQTACGLKTGKWNFTNGKTIVLGWKNCSPDQYHPYERVVPTAAPANND